MLIVVTGAEGFIGRRLVRRLAATGVSVVAVDRVPAGGELPAGVRRHTADLAAPHSLLPGDLEGRPFTLVHLAWDLRRNAQAEQRKQPGILGGLLDDWSDRGLAALVGVGSAEEYGSAEGVLGEDAAPVCPLSVYGEAKRAAFRVASGWGRERDRSVTWLRPFIVYGPGQGGDMLIPYALRQARRREKASFSDGLQRRDFVFVDDVADALALAAGKRLPGVNVLNVGRGEAVEVKALLREAERLAGAAGLFELGARPRRSGEPDVQVADTTRMTGALGWTASTDWRSGLAKTVREDFD